MASQAAAVPDGCVRTRALFDDGGIYAVCVAQGPLPWRDLTSILQAHAGAPELAQRIASRAGGDSQAALVDWYAVLYVQYGNYEWIPAQWINTDGDLPGGSLQSAWHTLWKAALHNFQSKHFLRPVEVQQPIETVQRLVQTTKRRPKNVSAKFWVQRRLLWSRWDYGVQMDDVGWFSVTPEPAAKQIAQLLGPMRWPVKSPTATTPATSRGFIVDAFAGVGGNAIQFALHCCGLGAGPAACPTGAVIAMDNSSERIELLRHNARIYGIESRAMGEGVSAQQVPPLLCFAGDSLQQLQDGAVSLREMLKVDLGETAVHIGAVYLAPPWGGEFYASKTPTLSAISVQGVEATLDGCQIFWLAAQAAPTVLYYLPRQCSLESVLEELSSHGDACRPLPRAGAGQSSSLQWVSIMSHSDKVVANLLMVTWS